MTRGAGQPRLFRANFLCIVNPQKCSQSVAGLFQSKHTYEGIIESIKLKHGVPPRLGAVHQILLEGLCWCFR